MTFSFVFVPRMHEDISDCYRLLGDEIKQNSVEGKQIANKNAEANSNIEANKNAENIENLPSIDIAYFSPFLGTREEAMEKYIVVNPQFPWKKEEAYQYIEDFRKSTLEYGKENQRQIQSYFAINESELANVASANLNISNMSGFAAVSTKRLNKEEELALDSFVKGDCEHEKKISPSNNESIGHKKMLEQAQKVLIIAWLQEEQDMELFVIQQKISQKDHVIKDLLKNPYERKLLESEPFSESLKDELYKDLRKNEDEIKESFSFNVPKAKQSIEKEELSYTWSEKDFNALEFSTSWRRLFLAQLHFMPEDTVFIVNDRAMRDDLVNIALDSEENDNTGNTDNTDNTDNTGKANKGKAQSKVRFDENIVHGHYEQEELKSLQKVCSQSHSHYSFLSCPWEMIFKEKTQDLSEKMAKELHFLLKRN